MYTKQSKSAVYDSELVIFRHSDSVVVTSDGGFLTIWVFGDQVRCQFVHRLSQLDITEQVKLAKDLVHDFISNT
jgi:hypothetical protein